MIQKQIMLVSNYAGVSTPYSVSDNMDDLISSLQKSSKVLLKWFDDKQLYEM